jgi:hypothetical protein
VVAVVVVVWVTVTGGPALLVSVTVRVTVAGAGGGLTGTVADRVGLALGVGVASEDAVGLGDTEGTVCKLSRSHPTSTATNPATATATNTRAPMLEQRAIKANDTGDHPSRRRAHAGPEGRSSNVVGSSRGLVGISESSWAEIKVLSC